MFTMFLTDAAQQPTGSSLVVILGELVFFFAIAYFLIIRPQKKQQKEAEELRNSVQPGDNIMTTSGFYGVILDVVDDDTVIVEFGNNKNCRIPMSKNAIQEVEKDEEAKESK